MLINLYFQPSIYSSSAIIEIKSNEKEGAASDFLLNAFSAGKTGQIDKELELLKTFSINNKALERVNFQTKYYENKNYKKIELYKQSPIQVNNIDIFNNKIIGKEIILYPLKNGFKLKLTNSFKEKTLKMMFSETLLSLKSGTIYQYNKEIVNEYFKLTVHKKENMKKNNVTKPIHFVIYGDNRQIYDKIISKNLKIMQINKNAPLIKISYQDNIPKRADAYVNALAQSFITQSITYKNEQNNKILTFINQQLENIKEKLKESENRLENYRVSHSVIDPSIQAETYIRELSNIEIKLSEIF